MRPKFLGNTLRTWGTYWECHHWEQTMFHAWLSSNNGFCVGFFELKEENKGCITVVCHPNDLTTLVASSLWKLCYWSYWQKRVCNCSHVPMWTMWDANELFNFFLLIFFSYEFFLKFIENIALLLLLPRSFLSSGVSSSSWIIHHKYLDIKLRLGT